MPLAAFAGSLKKHSPICAPKLDCQLPGAGMAAPEKFANSAVAPVRAHDAAVVTTAPAFAVYATPKS